MYVPCHSVWCTHGITTTNNYCADVPLPPVSKNRRVSDPVQDKCTDIDVVSFPSGVFQLCGIDELKGKQILWLHDEYTINR